MSAHRQTQTVVAGHGCVSYTRPFTSSVWQAVCADQRYIVGADEFSCLSQFSNICCYEKEIRPPNTQDLTVKCSLFISSLTDLLVLTQYRFGLSISQAPRTWAICQVGPNKITMGLLSMYINIYVLKPTKNMARYLLFHLLLESLIPILMYGIMRCCGPEN